MKGFFPMRCSQLLAAVFGVLGAGLATAEAAENCAHCGGCDQVRKVCRVICEWEEVKKVTYCCQFENFCVPGPSHKCGCREIPTCGNVRTRHKLVKKEEVHRVPKHRCVVEYLCPDCCHGGALRTADHAAPEGSVAEIPVPTLRPLVMPVRVEITP
jgi:hypothetical protein